jgi:hypothetical protein
MGRPPLILLDGSCRVWVLTLRRLLLGILLCAAMIAEANAQKISFPGAKSETKSPDGRYTIRNADDEKQEPAHTLTLIDVKDGSTTKIYSYPRRVDVLWSPTSRAFVVNDHEGSDASHPVLFTAPWTNQSIDLRENLIGFLRSGHGAKSVEENHHVYFSAQRWLDGKEILCQVTGYGDVDPQGFTAQYVYQIGAGFRLVNDRCDDPPGLRDALSKKYPGTSVLSLADLDDYDRKLFQKDHHSRCPGLVKLDFYGDGKPTWALVLIAGEKSKRKAELVVAQQAGEGWELRSLDTADGTPVVWRQGPGKYQGMSGPATIQARNQVIVFCGYESWAILYAWTGKEVVKTWLSD